MFEKFLNNKHNWLNEQELSGDIVFSSRIRLARNLSDSPFPSRSTESQKIAVTQRMFDTYSKIEEIKTAEFIPLDSLNDWDRRFLLERHLVSQEHIFYQNNPKELAGRAAIITADEKISIMINEEDHLRIQSISHGFNLRNCWQIIDRLDDRLDEYMPLAFSGQIGYLTACPTNAGTGLRVSCMLHLPALVLAKQINKILELLAKVSFTTRGLFGEGTQALGNFFQISNQGSMGHSELELIDNLCGVVNQVREQEMNARQILLKKHRMNVEDDIWRALGILRNSRLISSKEALERLSMLSLGIDLGIIKGIKKELVNNLFISIQPAHLIKIEGKEFNEGYRDYARASFLRKTLIES